MIYSYSHKSCIQARPFFYDYIHRDTQEGLPEDISKHIKLCHHCQAEVHRLQEELENENAFDCHTLPEFGSAVARNLRLHFNYLNRRVTCGLVKPFLCTQSIPELEMTIPTPITVHINHCSACSEDLEAIRDMNLSNNQLRRLAQILAKSYCMDSSLCCEVENKISTIIKFHYEKVTHEIYEHVCICTKCRKLHFSILEMMHCNAVASLEYEQPLCETVEQSDIFDYVIPFGIDWANDNYAKIREPFIRHMQRCHACLGRMLDLHRKIYDIVDRNDSGISTIMQTDMSAEETFSDYPTDLYSDWPVKVKVIDRTNQDIDDQAVQAGAVFKDISIPRKRLTGVKKRRYIKVAAAAAIILMAFTLLRNVPSVQAIEIDQIYQALQKIMNVCVLKYDPDKQSPIQEKRLSHSFGQLLIKTGDQVVLWDLQNNLRKMKTSTSILVESTSINIKDSDKLRHFINTHLGLLPFDDISDIPVDAEWRRLSDDKIENVSPGTYVYELEWQEKMSDGSLVSKIWRCFIEPKTHLPLRIERYIKKAEMQGYQMDGYSIVSYNTDREFKKVAEDLGFAAD